VIILGAAGMINARIKLEKIVIIAPEIAVNVLL